MKIVQLLLSFLVLLVISVAYRLDFDNIKQSHPLAIDINATGGYNYAIDICRDKQIKSNRDSRDLIAQGLRLLTEYQARRIRFVPTKKFCQAIKLDSNNAQAYIGLGYSLSLLGEASGSRFPFEGAQAAYRKAIDINPQSILAYKALASVLDDIENGNEKYYVYRKLSELNPKDASAYIGLGDTVGSSFDTISFNEQSSKSEAYYNQAIALDPKNIRPYLSLCVSQIFSISKYQDKVISACRKAVEIAPKNSVAYIGLGNSLLYVDTEKATTAYRQAIALDSPSYLAYFAYLGLGQALSRLNKFDQAEANYRQAIKIYPSDRLTYELEFGLICI
ncbi:tetratricopeptide repeat protein [Halotia wernerae UHCC 0503]|nr:tetratricopeptide repeat protein [Halotia wernerae UHCC 0503]